MESTLWISGGLILRSVKLPMLMFESKVKLKTDEGEPKKAKVCRSADEFRFFSCWQCRPGIGPAAAAHSISIKFQFDLVKLFGRWNLSQVPQPTFCDKVEPC